MLENKTKLVNQIDDDDDDALLSASESKAFLQQCGDDLRPFMETLKQKGYIPEFIDKNGNYLERIVDVCYLISMEIKGLLFWEKNEDHISALFDKKILSHLQKPDANLNDEELVKQLINDTKHLFYK